MSFSVQIKEELSKLNNFNKVENIKAELLGFLCTSNVKFNSDYLEIITENEFCIERLYKILFKLKIDYIPDINGKLYIARIENKHILNCFEANNNDMEELIVTETEMKSKLTNLAKNINEKEMEKDIVKGAFLGSGSINEPEKNYHLELLFEEQDKLDLIITICSMFGIQLKYLKNAKGLYVAYLKEGESISNFLAMIGSNNGVLKFEEIRVIKELKNDVNRKVNCETANLNRTIDAALSQIEDIKFLKQMKKFDELSDEMKEIAYLRLENPDTSLKDLGKMLKNPIGKSGVNHRLKKIQALAEEYRNILQK